MVNEMEEGRKRVLGIMASILPILKDCIAGIALHVCPAFLSDAYNSPALTDFGKKCLHIKTIFAGRIAIFYVRCPA